MTTRFSIAVLISMIVNAVLFGTGAVVVLSVPALTAYANILLPAVVVLSFVLSPLLAWQIAPMMRARYVRTELLRQRLNRPLPVTNRR